MTFGVVGMESCSEPKGSSGPPGDGDGDGAGTGGSSIDLGMGGSGTDIDLDGDGMPDPPALNCGDGLLDPDEACDDGNEEDGDGCFSHCLAVEPGFTCPMPNQPCQPFAKCGDGIVYFPEGCDDGDQESGDGCSDNCKVEIGFACDGEPSTCTTTTCGDGIQEGAEGCEHEASSLIEGQPVPFLGCTVDTCQKEPDCSGTSCNSPCGDGLRINEECDDGNTLDGDGCSSACEVEDGYECTSAPCEIYDPDGDGEGQCLLRVPAIFRDFNLSFEDMFAQGVGDCGETAGLVEANLVSGKPVSTGDVPGCITSAETFAKWYTESSPTNRTTIGEILLFDDGNGGFVNRYGNNGDGLTPTQFQNLTTMDLVDGNPSFFPIDGSEYVLTDTRHGASIPPDFYGGVWGVNTGSHNFHFTTEVKYWFTYSDDMDATLNFTGDDDVWVFINGRLAVDLGGTHVPIVGSVQINGNQVLMDDLRGPTEASAGDFGLQDGNVYEIKVFQAERKQEGSSFRLTLAGFDTARSDCRSQCGDGIIGAGEECDDGENDGGYNECQAGCILGGYCGDGIVQEGEACDDADPDKPDACSGCRILLVK